MFVMKVIAPSLTRMFLHSIHMEIPDDARRSEMLQWLLKKHGMTTHADAASIVSQTSGYLYADLAVLVSLAVRYVKFMYKILENKDCIVVQQTKNNPNCFIYFVSRMISNVHNYF